MADRMITANEKAFAMTMLTYFMHKLHFDESFAKHTAVFIKSLDKDMSNDELNWRFCFGLGIAPLVDKLAEEINEKMGSEITNE